jgi:hypothetical protein
MGQWENQSRNNVGAASFLYPRNGEVVTALHESVSADEFLGSLKDDIYLTGNIHFNLFSYGWKGEKAYHTLEAGIRAAYSASVPKEIFTILKLGTGEVSYDLSGINVAGNAVVELAYGYSRKLSDLISVGARAKLLVGIEALRYNVTRFDLTMQEDAYQAQVEADLDLTSRWSKIRANDETMISFFEDENGDEFLCIVHCETRFYGDVYVHFDKSKYYLSEFTMNGRVQTRPDGDQADCEINDAFVEFTPIPAALHLFKIVKK